MKKNTFLYIVIAVLVIALAGLGALNVRSLDKLASLQTKVNKLQKSVQEVSDSAAELSSKADQLDALYPDDPTVSSAAAAASSAEVQGPSAQEESTDTSVASDSSEASGSKDSLFFPPITEPGPYMYAILQKIPKVPSMISRCRLPA